MNVRVISNIYSLTTNYSLLACELCSAKGKPCKSFHLTIPLICDSVYYALILLLFGILRIMNLLLISNHCSDLRTINYQDILNVFSSRVTNGCERLQAVVNGHDIFDYKLLFFTYLSGYVL
jgi:hypothetical protein